MSNEQSGGATTRTEPPDNLDVSPTVSSSWPRSTSTSMYRRILLIVAIVVCFVLGVYFKYFHRLPTEDILAANLALQTATAEDFDYDEVGANAVKRSQRDWDQWIKRNRFISIGKLFDKCGEINRSYRKTLICLTAISLFGYFTKTVINYVYILTQNSF